MFGDRKLRKTTDGWSAFDLLADPKELHSSVPADGDDGLVKLLEEFAPVRRTGSIAHAPIDPARLERLKALGYLDESEPTGAVSEMSIDEGFAMEFLAGNCSALIDAHKAAVANHIDR